MSRPAIPAHIGTANSSPGLALVSMPFGPLFLPSIGLGLLKSAVAARGIPVADFYFTFALAERIGVQRYLDISNGLHSTSDLLGEWIFAKALFGPDPVLEQRYIEDVLGAGSPAHRKDGWYGAPQQGLTRGMPEKLIALRDQEPFIESCVDAILGARPAIAGFTSVFQQQTASLATARRLKQRDPRIVTVLGGANCEGEMGLEILRQFPFVDCVVSGEADLVFPDVVEAVLNEQPIPRLPGVHTQETIRRAIFTGRAASSPPVQRMDELPTPDYDGFFRQFEESRPRLSQVFQPHILFETSRGCYWGKVSHCTFCGLNGANMAFRSKSAQRALDELQQLTERHPGSPVTVVDNILDMQYFQTFLPDLAARKLDLNLFYEVKANLKKEQVRLLRDARILAIQPGIESLSTRILTEMKKGCTALQNVGLLKWCKEFGIKPIWNILWGFPAEDERDYQQMTGIIPLLAHLEPPQVAASLRLDRFSPYFEHAQDFGLVNARPYPAYSYVYRLPESAIRNLAYYYTFDYAPADHAKPRNPHHYTRELVSAVMEWQAGRNESDLFMADLGSALLICDLRRCAVQPFHLLTGVARSLYLACDGARGIAALEKMSGSHAVGILQELVDRGLMLRDGDSFLSLAADLVEYAPPKNIRLRFIDAVRTYGKPYGNEFEVAKAGSDVLEIGKRKRGEKRQAVSVDHFRIGGEGRVLVDLEALERIDIQHMGSLLWR